MDFTAIKTPNELKLHLNAPYVNSICNNIYHYTSLKNLYEIFKNKTIRFSKLAVMNDAIECDFAKNCSDYFFCLSKEPCGLESFGMWAMYGKLKEVNEKQSPENVGVKIQFTKEVIENLRNDNSLSFHSVTYWNKKTGQLLLGTRKNDNNIQITENVLSGYIKDVCWKYENEYRLRKTFNSDETKIDIPISESLLNELIIYPSPVSSVEKCKKLFENLESENGRATVFPKFEKNSYEGTFFINQKC